MSLTGVEPSLDSLDALSGVDAVCLFVAEDDRPLPGAAGYADWRLCGAISRILEGGFFKGHRGEQLLMPTSGRLSPVRLFVVGVGPSTALHADTMGAIFQSAAEMLSKAKVSSVALSPPRSPQVDDATRAQLLKSKFAAHFEGPVQVLAERGLKALL